MPEKPTSPGDYLRRPYRRSLIPDVEVGGFTALIDEFPGCIAEGETPEEAYSILEEVAHAWIESALSLGQRIPDPQAENEFSGRFALRLPKSVHRDAAAEAERDGTSLNQFILAAVAEKIGERKGKVEARIEIQRSIEGVRAEIFYAAAVGVNYGLQISSSGCTSSNLPAEPTNYKLQDFCEVN